MDPVEIATQILNTSNESIKRALANDANNLFANNKQKAFVGIAIDEMGLGFDSHVVAQPKLLKPNIFSSPFTAVWRYINPQYPKVIGTGESLMGMFINPNSKEVRQVAWNGSFLPTLFRSIRNQEEYQLPIRSLLNNHVRTLAQLGEWLIHPPEGRTFITNAVYLQNMQGEMHNPRK